MPRCKGGLTVLSWNCAGARYLEKETEAERNSVRSGLNRKLVELLETENPDVVLLQEVVQVAESGHQHEAIDIIDITAGSVMHNYVYMPCWLIDTQGRSGRIKWEKDIERGHWPPETYFAQGNAVLLRRSPRTFFPLLALPRESGGVPAGRAAGGRVLNASVHARLCFEEIRLMSGVWLGTRDTEPRSALVTHLVLTQLPDAEAPHALVNLVKPLDVFVVNVHLTTLLGERDGISTRDAEAARIRLSQLSIILDDIVSRYNVWREGKYCVGNKQAKVDPRLETSERHPPIWIVAGDFNFQPNSIEYQTMIRSGFIDLHAKVPDDSMSRTNTKSSGVGNPPIMTLDYLFAGPRYSPLQPSDVMPIIKAKQSPNKVLSTKVSDHMPIVAHVPLVVEE